MTWISFSAEPLCALSLNGGTQLPPLCPVLPIGAENLLGKITAQGSAVAQQPTRRRRALDCDLARREDARHGGRASRGFHMARCRVCVTAGHHPTGCSPPQFTLSLSASSRPSALRPG